uniref:Uncharacterized protein n=1 Tax=Nocardia farcinica TaxID=37329 RepID=A0A449G5T9_NOCFR
MIDVSGDGGKLLLRSIPFSTNHTAPKPIAAD